MEYPLCSCDEMWCGEGRHAPDCPVVAEFDRLREELAEVDARNKTLTDSLCARGWLRPQTEEKLRAEAAEERAQYWEGRCNFAWARMDEMFLAHWDNAILTEKETKLRAVVEAAQAARPENWMDVPSIHRLIDLYRALDALEGE